MCFSVQSIKDCKHLAFINTLLSACNVDLTIPHITWYIMIYDGFTCFTVFEVHCFHNNKVMPVHWGKCNCNKKQKKQISVLHVRLEVTKSYHANVAGILLNKLQQMQDSRACIQLSKPVHSFHVTKEKLDVSLIPVPMRWAPELKPTVCTCKWKLL